VPPHKNILAINGSASENSSNQRLIDNVVRLIGDDFHVTVYNDLKKLPHFDPTLSSDNPPKAVVDLRNSIEQADGVFMCTPEYIFAIPAGLKNAIEWCVSTTIFTDKPLGIITASLHGAKGHEELKLIMSTVMARFTDETTLLIPGIKSKINAAGEIVDDNMAQELAAFADAFRKLIANFHL
jgi:chromate reductase